MSIVCRRVQAWDPGFKGHARSFADAFLAKLWFDSAGDRKDVDYTHHLHHRNSDAAESGMSAFGMAIRARFKAR